MGYASRAAGRDQDAEKYFQRLAQAYPTLYVPWLALGDMYTSRHDYARAESAYSKGYSMAPGNALIVAGGINADIEAHKLDAAVSYTHLRQRRRGRFAGQRKWRPCGPSCARDRRLLRAGPPPADPGADPAMSPWSRR